MNENTGHLIARIFRKQQGLPPIIYVHQQDASELDCRRVDYVGGPDRDNPDMLLAMHALDNERTTKEVEARVEKLWPGSPINWVI